MKSGYFFHGSPFIIAELSPSSNSTLVGLNLALFSVCPATCQPANHPPTRPPNQNSCKVTRYRNYEIKQSIEMEDNLNGRRPQ